MLADEDASEGGEAEPPSKRWRLLPLLCGVLFLGLGLHAARVETPTIDEFAHVPAGLTYAEHGEFQLYSKNPPLLKLVFGAAVLAVHDVEVPRPPREGGGWKPWSYGARFGEKNPDLQLAVYFAARCVVLGLALLTGLLLWWWARALSGERAAAIVSGLFLLAPNLLAHGHVATVDVGCTFSVFLGLFCVRWCWLAPSVSRAAITGVVWGLALLVKFSALLFLPLVVLAWFLFRRDRPRALVLELTALFVAANLTVNAGMGFQGSFEPLGGYAFESRFCSGAQDSLPAWLPMPLPRTYVLGFDAQKLDTEAGEFGSYLMGEWSERGWWHYYLVALLVKTPLTFLLLLVLIPVGWVKRRPPARELYLIGAPLFLLFGIMSFLNSLNVGVRYLLPGFPLAYLAMAPLFACAPRGSSARARLVGWAPAALFAYSLLTIARVHPSYLGYFNELAGGPRAGHRWLIASNLDWGQDLYRLPDTLAELGVDEPIQLLYFGHVHPARYGIEYTLLPGQPVDGVVVASVNYLKGWPYLATAPDGSLVPTERDRLAWLAEHEPVARIGTLWIYDLRQGPARR